MQSARPERGLQAAETCVLSTLSESPDDRFGLTEAGALGHKR